MLLSVFSMNTVEANPVAATRNIFNSFSNSPGFTLNPFNIPDHFKVANHHTQSNPASNLTIDDIFSYLSNLSNLSNLSTSYDRLLISQLSFLIICAIVLLILVTTYHK